MLTAARRQWRVLFFLPSIIPHQRTGLQWLDCDKHQRQPSDAAIGWPSPTIPIFVTAGINATSDTRAGLPIMLRRYAGAPTASMRSGATPAGLDGGLFPRAACRVAAAGVRHRLGRPKRAFVMVRFLCRDISSRKDGNAIRLFATATRQAGRAKSAPIAAPFFNARVLGRRAIGVKRLQRKNRR
jgi:hypothetical protein